MANRLQPEDKDQLLVQTPYGKGLVVRTRKDHVREIQLLEWEKTVRTSRLAVKQYGYGSKSSLVLYTSSNLKTVEPQRGDDVITPFGRGRVVNIVNVVIKKKNSASGSSKNQRSENKSKEEQVTQPSPEECNGESRLLIKYQVELTSWRLAGRSKVKCFFFPKDVKVVRKKKLEEMNATERVEFAQRQKASAVSVFGKKQYQQALNLYAGAVDAVRFVQHDASSSNEVRADLVEVMVTCSNNAATCCVQMARWPEAAKFAQNAIVLLDALYKKKGMKIHTILNRDNGLCDAKIFGEWRVKSLLVIARACAERKEYEDAIDILKRARDVIGSFCNVGGNNYLAERSRETDALTKVSLKNLQAQEKEVRKLLAKVIERKKAEKKREKQRAKAMFGGERKKESNEISGANSSVNAREIVEEKKEAVLELPGKDGEHSLADKGTLGGREDVSANSCGVSSMGSVLKSVTSISVPETKPNMTKRVSFSDKVEEREIESDEEEEPWYAEHKEALLLLGMAGVASVAFVVLRGLKRG